MPKEYEKMRDFYVRKGLSLKVAKRRAAATYNKYIAPKKDGAPVTGKSHG